VKTTFSGWLVAWEERSFFYPAASVRYDHTSRGFLIFWIFLPATVVPFFIKLNRDNFRYFK